MKFKLEIDCDNAAFDDAPRQEIERILEKLTRDVLAWGLLGTIPLYDTNGNRVGRAWIE